MDFALGGAGPANCGERERRRSSKRGARRHHRHVVFLLDAQTISFPRDARNHRVGTHRQAESQHRRDEQRQENPPSKSCEVHLRQTGRGKAGAGQRARQRVCCGNGQPGSRRQQNGDGCSQTDRGEKRRTDVNVFREQHGAIEFRGKLSGEPERGQRAEQREGGRPQQNAAIRGTSRAPDCGDALEVVVRAVGEGQNHYAQNEQCIHLENLPPSRLFSLSISSYIGRDYYTSRCSFSRKTRGIQRSNLGRPHYGIYL